MAKKTDGLWGQVFYLFLIYGINRVLLNKFEFLIILVEAKRYKG